MADTDTATGTDTPLSYKIPMENTLDGTNRHAQNDGDENALHS